MRKLITISAFLLIGIICQAQINTKHLFGNISVNDLTASKSLRGGISSTSTFLRAVISETAYEIPLKKGVPQQFFAATGLGLSLAFYGVKDNVVAEKFTLNAIVFTPNNSNDLYGISTALTAGVPIPLLNLPIINAGIRYDWKTKIAFLQTSVTLEF
jgi:hypothetical protein